MRVQVIPIDFMGQQPLMEPRDRRLHDAVIDYIRLNLINPVDLVRFNKVWVAVEDPVFNESGMYVNGNVIGITGWMMKVDIPMFRVTGPNASRATKMLTDRLHDHLGDNGLRGHEVFVHISSVETPEQKCPSWQEGLQATDAKPADRYAVIVR